MQSIEKNSFYHFVVFVKHDFLSFCYVCKDIFFYHLIKIDKEKYKKSTIYKEKCFYKNTWYKSKLYCYKYNILQYRIIKLTVKTSLLHTKVLKHVVL